MSKLMRRNGSGTTLIDRMQEEVEDMFHRLFEPAAGAEWAPRVDVAETDAAILVTADLPGVDAKDVEVTVQNRNLVLRGEKNEEKGKNFHRAERFSGTFYRSVTLPAEADTAGVTATSAKGVVTVTIPKKPGAQAKRIPVQAKDA